MNSEYIIKVKQYNILVFCVTQHGLILCKVLWTKQIQYKLSTVILLVLSLPFIKSGS